MSSQSRFVTHKNPEGLGLMANRPADPLINDDRKIPEPVDRTSSGGSVSTAIKVPTVIQPIITTTSTPQTGGGSPIVNPVSNPVHEKATDSKGSGSNPAPIARVEGDGLVFNGTYQVSKKQAVIIGGAIGAALLFKFIL